MYTFPPMMPIYTKLASTPEGFLNSQDGRKMLAKCIKFCRQKYGKEEGRRFWNAVTILRMVP